MLTQTRKIGVALLFATLLIASQAFAQLGQTVSGTLTDPTGAAYANGTYTFTFVAGPGGTTIGSNQSVATQSGALNGSGAFSGVLLGNTDFLGGGARWRANICAANGQCFSALFNVTSSTSSLSATLSAFAPLLVSPSAGNLVPATAGNLTLGTGALPWEELFLGAAATNNAELVGTFGQATVLTIPDPGGASDTFVLLGATQTLTGKTLTAAKVTTSIAATTAGAATIGTAALPFGSVYLGGSATNNFILTGTAGQATTITIPDPGVASETANGIALSTQFCGATSGATQACAKTVKTLGLLVFGNVTLNTAATQAITTLPFTAAGDYSCWGSDFTNAAGIVSFSVYTSGASATIKESGGGTSDVLYYGCAGF